MVETELEFRGIDASECTAFIREVHKRGYGEGKFKDFAWMADLAALAFDGPALVWLDRQSLETQADWILLRRALLDRYCDNWVPSALSSVSSTAYTRTGNPNQDWIPDTEPLKASYSGPFSIGFPFRIRNAHSKKAMDLTHNNPAPGTQIVNWAVNDGQSQIWILEAGKHGYRIKSAAHNNSYLGFAQGVSPTTPGSIISGNPTPVEWTIALVNNLAFIHLARDPNFVLDLAECNVEDGTRILVWPRHGEANQGWIFEAAA